MVLVNEDKEALAEGPTNGAEKRDLFPVRNKGSMEEFRETRHWSLRFVGPKGWAELYASLGLPSFEETLELRRATRNRQGVETAANVEKLETQIKALDEQNLAKDVELTHLLCKISLLEVANEILGNRIRNLRKATQEGGQRNMISFFDEGQSDED
ncbi:hypothetical protein DL768_002131 [Monosporascus sp. mg162]|nr:hypothetical protein DL768_002131 [Monosporascus sp. mg162]